MRLRPFENFHYFCAGTVFIRQNLTYMYKDGPRAAMFKTHPGSKADDFIPVLQIRVYQDVRAGDYGASRLSPAVDVSPGSPGFPPQAAVLRLL